MYVALCSECDVSYEVEPGSVGAVGVERMCVHFSVPYTLVNWILQALLDQLHDTYTHTHTHTHTYMSWHCGSKLFWNVKTSINAITVTQACNYGVCYFREATVLWCA